MHQNQVRTHDQSAREQNPPITSANEWHFTDTSKPTIMTKKGFNLDNPKTNPKGMRLNLLRKVSNKL